MGHWFDGILSLLRQIARPKEHLLRKNQRLRKRSHAIRCRPCPASSRALQGNCADIYPSFFPTVIRIRGIAVGRPVCRKRQQPDPAQLAENRTLVSCPSPASASNTAHALPIVRPSSPTAASWSETTLRCRLEEPIAATNSLGCTPELGGGHDEAQLGTAPLVLQ